ncbi:Lrp/AsnC family transcriptional regulator [Candidimonas humi]|jgi:Lrp/AsnC family transcriptional regulator|uniref:Lrp/AsnC family transcriptional regulator n=1 Tax=Candidimonas humi TaxID=683355 RepID=A0ABV8NT94_9BURK|nr:Lrp/AsnC family transcriptional regulator [Candidimonas humi]MBV6305941.1 Lrp/AsnC family transcriptional regulator [Candidimonas humi]
MDKTDKKILHILQDDATLSVGAVAEAVHLSTTACWKRIQNLEERGVIRKRVALLDPAQLNLGMTVFVTIKTSHHDLLWLRKFSEVVRDIPEVVEFYRMSGEVDYLLRIVVPDIQAYDQVYKRLIKDTQLSDVSSSFAMEELKNTTALPLDFV